MGEEVIKAGSNLTAEAVQWEDQNSGVVLLRVILRGVSLYLHVGGGMFCAVGRVW